MKNLNSPPHEEVAQRAREIWSARGSPGGCDVEIWLEAERQLGIGPPAAPAKAPAIVRAASDAAAAPAFVAHVKAERVAEHAVEYFISPSDADDDGVPAGLQSSNFLPASFDSEQSRWRGLW